MTNALFPIEFAELNDGFELSVADQKIALQGGQITTFIRKGDAWEPFFSAVKSLLNGSLFDLVPGGCRLLENSASRVSVLITGTHAEPHYQWDALVEARSDSPWLRIRITCHLTAPLTIDSPQPSAALWLPSSDDLVTLDQGPVSIYGRNSWGNSFPAAYLWTGGKEAILFFNPTPSRWMSKDNLRGFLDYRVATLQSENEVGFGLHALSKSGDTLPADHLVVEYYLLTRERQERPTRLQALDATVHACTALLPASAPLPENRVAPYTLTWETFTEGVIADLMRETISWAEIPSTWTDAPAFPEVRVEKFRLHSDYAIGSSRILTLNRKDVFQVWDYACCNNFVAPWLAYNRLKPDEAQHEMLAQKLLNVPMFYDPGANLMRWGAAGVQQSPGLQNTMVNGVEMSWENFMFHLETAKIHNAAAPEDFNPAILGKLLMACSGLVEYAHKVNYVFPQWFDAYDKTPMMQLDLPELGKVREPFQVGSYAYIMLEAYRCTGDTRWLDEAKTSLKYVLTEMQYTEVNRRYTTTFTEAVDVPIAETFGSGYAVAAAQQLYNLTSDDTYRQYARDYFNIFVRMAFWYDDESDATSRDLNNLGLFRAHGGHYGTCPWENIEAYLPLTVYLKYDTYHEALLLKLFNLQRITSYYFFAPTWSTLVAEPNPELYHHECQYLPIENFYTLEFGGTHGSMGRCIYMCSQAPWNYLLYEAFATVSDPEVMILSLDVLDGYDLAMSGSKRHFILFNPMPQPRTVTLAMHFLTEDEYRLTWADGDKSRVQPLSAAALTAGVTVVLQPMQRYRLHLEGLQTANRRDEAIAIRSAQNAIVEAYALLQQSGGARADLKERYTAALDAYKGQQYENALEGGRAVVAALRQE
jgi:hypothetical protein